MARMQITKLVTTEDDRETDYAATIIQQIREADPLALGAWGVTQIYLREQERSVKFNVKGLKHQGWVMIHLRSDLYTVETCKMDASVDFEWTVVESHAGIYFDNLVPVLDEMIEGKK